MCIDIFRCEVVLKENGQPQSNDSADDQSPDVTFHDANTSSSQQVSFYFLFLSRYSDFEKMDPHFILRNSFRKWKVQEEASAASILAAAK